MKCLNCDKDTPNKKFCTKSCSVNYNNKLRKVSDETKNRISNKLATNVDLDKLKLYLREEKTAVEISILMSVSKTTVLNWLNRFNLKTSYQLKIDSDKCPKCNKEYRVTVSGNRYCVDCKSDEVKSSRRDIKETLVEYKGGKCERCGYSKCLEALEFHHINPNEKDFSISRGNKSIEKMKLEVDKCLLLCANCHREEHVNLKLNLTKKP